jgi:methionyl-tRNA formyltransferase
LKKIAVFGCKSTTLFLIEALMKKLVIACVITISPEEGQKAQVADYVDISNYCAKKGICCYTARKYDLKNEQDQDTLQRANFDIGFVIGWQRLIPEEVISDA